MELRIDRTIRPVMDNRQLPVNNDLGNIPMGNNDHRLIRLTNQFHQVRELFQKSGLVDAIETLIDQQEITSGVGRQAQDGIVKG